MLKKEYQAQLIKNYLSDKFLNEEIIDIKEIQDELKVILNGGCTFTEEKDITDKRNQGKHFELGFFIKDKSNNLVFIVDISYLKTRNIRKFITDIKVSLV